jgi:hypothetical protein
MSRPIWNVWLLVPVRPAAMLRWFALRLALYAIDQLPFSFTLLSA